jgi:hypothetical protein
LAGKMQKYEQDENSVSHARILPFAHDSHQTIGQTGPVPSNDVCRNDNTLACGDAMGRGW